MLGERRALALLCCSLALGVLASHVLHPSDSIAGEVSSSSPLVVAIGDSITWGYGAADPRTESWPAVVTASGAALVVNSGVFDNTTAQMRQRFPADVISRSPNAVVILGGFNDFSQAVPPEQVYESLAWMANEARLNGIRVYLGTLTPTASRCESIALINDWIRSFTRSQGVGIVDFFQALESPPGSGTSPYLFDWEHPNTTGYSVMAAVAKRAIENTTAPSANSDHFSAQGTLTLAVEQPGVLAGDVDADGDSLSAVLLTATKHGSLTLQASGGFEYRGSDGFAGVDTFTYAAFDGNLHSVPQTVTIDVWAGTKITLRPPLAAPSFGGSVKLWATLTSSSGAAIAGEPVIFEQWTGTRWLSVGTAMTNSSGQAIKYASGLTSRRAYRVRFAGRLPYRASTSSTAFISPKVFLANPVVPDHAYRGRGFSAYGYLKPRHAAGTYPVRIYKWRYTSGGWKSYGYITARASDYCSYTKYARSISLPYRGHWRLRAYAPRDSGHVATWSTGYDYVAVK